jgi:DNA-binding transcriptional LysR family regulator
MEWDDLTARRLSTRELRIFLAVAHLGSMAKAAKMLATSQPAVSKAIADMEHGLGVRLLDRSPQGVTTTEYCHALVKCGVAVFNELKQGISEIGFLSDPTAGELRIGCPEPLAAGLVQAVIERLLQKHPRMKIHVETTALYRELRERNVELIFNRMLGPIADEDLEAEILYYDSVVIVAGTDSPWTRRRRVQLAELVNEQWVMPKSDSTLWLPLTKAFRASGLKPPSPAVTTNSYHTRSSLLATGRFLSVRTHMALKFQRKHPVLKALPLKLPANKEPFAIIRLKSRTLSPPARLFIEHIRAVANEIAKRDQRPP